MCYSPKLEIAKEEVQKHLEQHPSIKEDLANMFVIPYTIQRLNTLVGAPEWEEIETPKSAALTSPSQSDEVGLQLNDITKLDQPNPAYIKPPTPLSGEAEMAHSNDGELLAAQQL